MKSVLMLPLEFTHWQQARAWSYTGNYSFFDGFLQNDIDCLSLPLFVENTTSYASRLIDFYKGIVHQQYDEVWVWCVHTQLSEKDWQWINSLAPKIVGVLMESAQYSEIEYQEFPHLRTRAELITKELSHCTHALVGNQSDADLIKQSLNIEVTWYLPMISEQFILDAEPPEEGKACFIGSCYAMREPYLKQSKLDDIIERPDLPERHCDAPEHFEKACQAYLCFCLESAARDIKPLKALFKQLKLARESLFNLQLQGIRMGRANVNLPSLFKAYPGRVMEAMAANVPVLSPIPCAELQDVFIDDQDILLFDTPECLRAQYEGLIAESDKALRISKSARNNLFLRHTARIRIQQLSQWIEQGVVPDFSHDKGYRPSLGECIYYDKLFNKNPNWSEISPNGDEMSRWNIIEGYIDSLALSGSEHALEVGCGRGWLSERLVKYCPVTAIEPVPEVTLRNLSRDSDVEYMVGSAETLLFLGKKNHYDLLVCSEVMEHIPAKMQSTFVENLVALVATDGHLIISTPRADIQAQWMEQYGDPAQPIEDWVMEKDLLALFEQQGCSGVELQRAFLLDIYQVWLFKKH